MIFNKLKPEELDVIWADVQLQARHLLRAAHLKDVMEFYEAADEIHALRMKLQSHFAACAVEESK